MGRVDVNKYNKQTNSDVFTLTNITDNQMVALIPSDSAGNFNWSGVRRAPLERNAMQTTTSSGEWSDLEYPWMAIQQEDWTGGRGNDRFTSDKSRFYDSKRCQSAFNTVIINGPLDYYSDGVKDSKTNCPASLTWKELLGDSQYVYQEIEFQTAMNIGEVYIHLKRVGSPAKMTVSLQNGVGSSPTVYATHDFTVSNVPDITAEFFKFSFTNVSLSGSVYLVISSTGGDSLNHWCVGTSVIAGHDLYTSADGTTWSDAHTQLLYRLQPKTVESDMKFFTYKQLMFMVKHTGEVPSLWINGDIGRVTATSTGATLTDTSKNWTTGMWVGAKVGIINGKGVEKQVESWADVTANTANTLTLSASPEVLENDSQYIITNTPHWTKLSASLIENSARRCSDVLVCRNTVYFCFGKYGANVVTMKWNGSALAFADAHFQADYLQSVRSTKGIMLWRGRNDDEYGQHSIERCLYNDGPDYHEVYNLATIAASSTETSTATELEAGNYSYRFDIGEYTLDEGAAGTLTIKVQESDDGVTWTDVISFTPAAAGTLVKRCEITKAKQQITVTTGAGLTVNNIVVDVFESLCAVEAASGSSTAKYSENCKLEHPDYEDAEYMVVTETASFDTTMTVYLEESQDGYAFDQAGKVTCYGAGIYYIQAKLKYPYYRIRYTIDSTGGTLGKITLSKFSTPHWVDRFTFLDNYGDITRLFEYGSDNAKSLWVFQEGMASSVTYNDESYNVDRINIDELVTTTDQYNGMAVATSDVYLLFGWLNGVQRYYNTQLEGKGPDKDEGLPSDRRGRISQILSYPSNWFVSVDGGSTGYSSVLMFNQSGWHEIYRAPNIGERIRDIAFQPIYGYDPDKLWMQVGDNAVWLAMPSKVLYAIQDPHALYTHESVLVSSWITGGMAEVDKLWQGIGIMADYLDGTNCWVEVDYQVDDEEEWHTVSNRFITSPSQEEDFSEYSVNGKKLRYRLRLQTTDITKTPKINVVLIKAIGRVDVKHSYSFYFRNIKYKPDLTGEYEDIEPYDLQCLLDEWANKLYKLRLNSAYKIFDDKLVFLDAVETSVLNELSEGYLGQITLTEV